MKLNNVCKFHFPFPLYLPFPSLWFGEGIHRLWKNLRLQKPVLNSSFSSASCMMIPWYIISMNFVSFIFKVNLQISTLLSQKKWDPLGKVLLASFPYMSPFYPFFKLHLKLKEWKAELYLFCEASLNDCSPSLYHSSKFLSCLSLYHLLHPLYLSNTILEI